MKNSFRKVLSIACAISLLLGSVPFHAYSEEVQPPQEPLIEQEVLTPENTQEEEVQPIQEPLAEQEILAPENTQEEEVQPPQEPLAEQEILTPENTQKEEGQPTQDTPVEQEKLAPVSTQQVIDFEELNNEDVTISKIAHANYVTEIPQTLDKSTWTVKEEKEARKEHVIRIKSGRDIDLYFLLTTDAEAEAVFSTEENENRKKFTEADAAEIPALSGEAGNHYILKKAHIEADGSRLIRIKSSTPTKFTLKVMTGSAWQKLTEVPAAEETEAKTEESTLEVEELEEVPVQEPVEETKEEKQEEPAQEAAEEENNDESMETVNEENAEEPAETEQPAEETQEEPEQKSAEEENNDESAETVNEEDTEEPAETEQPVEETQEEPEQEAAEEENNDESAKTVNEENAEEPVVTEELSEETQEEPAQEAAEKENNDESAETVNKENAEEPAEMEEPAEETQEEPEQEAAEEEKNDESTETVNEENAEEPAKTEEPAEETQEEPEQEAAEEENNDESAKTVNEENAKEPAENEESVEESEEEPAEETQEEAAEEATEETADETQEEAAEESQEEASEEEQDGNSEEELSEETEELEEEPEEDEFWETVISEHIDDYTVTVTVTREAEFPIGTTVKITPLNSTAKYRNEAAGIFDKNENELGTFIRVFDITFYYEDMEIEPLAPIDVKITFDNAVQLEGENELKLIHLHEEEEAKEIAVEAQTAEVKAEESISAGDETTQTVTNVESLSFQSGQFSTYIVAEEVVVYTFTDSGKDYEVVLKYNAGANMPEDAVFSVEEITEDSELYEQYRAQVAAVINPDGTVRMPALLDISLKKENGEKIQLGNKVQVIVRLTGENSLEKGLKVVHFPGEDPFQGESAVRDAVAESDAHAEIEVLDIDSEKLYARINTEENTVSFNTDSFSVFALAYTVDFYYGEFEYHMEGNSEMLLSELFTLLEIERDAADVVRAEFSNPSLLQVERTEDDWKLTSLQPFDTVESLTLNFRNGDTILLRVEDDSNKLYRVVVNMTGSSYNNAWAAGYFDVNSDYNEHTNEEYANGSGSYDSPLIGRTFTARPIGGYHFVFWLAVYQDRSVEVITRNTVLPESTPTRKGETTTFIACFAKDGAKLIGYVDPYYPNDISSRYGTEYAVELNGSSRFIRFFNSNDTAFSITAHSTSSSGKSFQGWYEGNTLIWLNTEFGYSNNPYNNNLSNLDRDIILTPVYGDVHTITINNNSGNRLVFSNWYIVLDQTYNHNIQYAINSLGILEIGASKELLINQLDGSNLYISGNSTTNVYFIKENDHGGHAYYDHGQVIGKDAEQGEIENIDFSIVTEGDSTVINFGAPISYTYTASLEFVDQTTSSVTIPALSGYTIEGIDGTDHYVADLVNGPLTFTKNGESYNDHLPAITNWTFKNGNTEITSITEFELSTTPTTETTSNDDVRNYKFTATKYKYCGLDYSLATGLNGNESDLEKYYVLVKQGNDYKYYARMNTLSIIYNVDGSVENDRIKGSSGYNFEVVEYNGIPDNINSLHNNSKLASIIINGSTYFITFPTEATENNYVITIAEPPKYSATISFMQEDGTTVSDSTGLTDEYYVLIKASINNVGERYSLSESAIDLSNLPATATYNVTFNDFSNDNSGLRYTGAGEIVEAYLVKNKTGAALTLNDAMNSNDQNTIEKIKLDPNIVLGTFKLTSSSAQSGNWSGKFTELPKYNASMKVMDSDGTTQINNPSITGTYYYLLKANVNSEKYALSDQPVDFTGENSSKFTTFYNQDGSNPYVTTYNGAQILNVYLVSNNSSGEKPSIPEAVGGLNGVQKYSTNQYENNNILDNIYILTGIDDGANYQATATIMPSYKVISSFTDSQGNSVSKALSQGYYLVAKATIDSTTAYYIDIYDPAKEYNIAHFYTEPDLTGGGNQYNGRTAYKNGSSVEVYLVEQNNVSEVSDVKNETVTKISNEAKVEIYTLGITSATNQTELTFTKDDITPELYTTTIKFFDENAEIIDAAGDIGMHVNEARSTKVAPSLSGNYYVLATIYNKGDISKATVGWAINPVSLNGHETTTTYFSEFIPYGSDGSTTEGTKINYYTEDFPYEVTTRLYRTDTAQTNLTYKTLVTDKTGNATDSAENGYEYVGNWNPDDSHNEIHLKKASPKTYAVRVRFKTNDISRLTTIGGGIGGNYYLVNVVVTHADGTNSVQYGELHIADFSTLDADDEGYLYEQLFFPYWRGTDGGEQLKDDSKTNPKFTGNERSIQVELLLLPNNVYPSSYQYGSNYGSSSKFAEGGSAGSYIVHYDTRWTNPQNTVSRFHEEEIAGGVIKCYDVIDLILPDADSEYDYATILGPNYSYGIVADHLFHNNDLQTNFAVNHYTGHGDYVTPDLSNTSGKIVIGEFNRNTDVMATNHVGPAVSTTSDDAEDIKAGTVPLGNNILGSLAIYADNDSGARYDTYDVAGGTPVSEERSKVHVFMQDGSSLQNSIVKPAIQYGVNMSRTLASKTATYTPQMVEGKPVVDTTGFLDNATIYIDADSMLTPADGGDGVYGTLYELINLKIVKKPGQMLIFNFKNTTNVRLKQFNVTYSDGTTTGDINNFNTNTTTNQSETNKKMEDISKHIVWNFASCTRRVELSEVGGICLQPNYGSETQISGTSGGWLVSAGYVYNSDAEWHNFFQEVPESTEVNMRVLKTVDGKVPAANEKFDFELYEYDLSASGTDKWVLRETVQNDRSSVKFTIKDAAGTSEEQQKLTPGWHVYKIVEKGKNAGEGVSALNYNIDTTEYYAAVLVNAIGDARIAGSPMYFSTFNAAQFTSADINEFIIGNVLSGPLTTVTFENEVKKEGLTIQKIVEGTNSAKVPFTFKIEVWTGEGTTAALTATEYTVTGLPGVSKITLTAYSNADNSTGTHSEGTLILKNGQTITITGLPIGSYYRITETNVNGKEIVYTGNTASEVDGYTAQTNAKEGTILSGGVKETFTNVYHAIGTATLKVHKELKNANGITLPENAFGFELTYGGTILDTKYNDANGDVTFGPVTFTEADMEGAILNPSTGKRAKIISLRVHEIDGAVEGFAYDQFINDDDKTILVTLMDQGNGEITTITYPADSTFRFNNEKAIEVQLEGSKLLIGRDMKNGEVFQFIVQETVSGETKTVATGTVRDARDGQETPISFTPIKYTEAGVHTYTISEVSTGAGSNLNYDSHTFTATVTVTDTNGNLSANVVYNPNPVKFINTSTETTSASVEKVWADGNGKHTNDRVKVRLYKVYGETVTAPAAGEEPTAYVPSANNTDAVPVTGGKEIDLPGTEYLPAGYVAIVGSEVMLSRANGWKHTWSKLPTIEKVSEDPIEWRKVTYYPVEVWTSNTNVTTTVYSLDSAIHKTTVTNTCTEQPGTLIITKSIPSGANASGTTFTFKVTFTKAGNAYAGNVSVVDATRTTATSVSVNGSGELTVTISGAGSATISDIPAGTGYTVVETDIPAGWMQTGSVVISGGNHDNVIEAGETETATITNRPGVELPSTGGAGTLAYTLSGLALITLAGVLLVSRKRKYNR